jgi:phosphoserine phosphatase RsbU/P
MPQSSSEPIAIANSDRLVSSPSNGSDRKQEHIHVILESLGFALRNFKNFNQYLEILPSMIVRITEADAGMVVLFRKNNPQPARAIHCRHKEHCPEVTRSIEKSLQKTLAITSDKDTQTTFNNYWEELENSLRENLALETTVRFFPVKIILDRGDALREGKAERGRLYIFSDDPNYDWSSDRQKLMQIVADQTAVAAVNEELTVELRKRDLLDREVEIGAEIQERLLPRKCPDIPGVDLAAYYQNANRVSGDYYDFIPANYDRIGSGVLDPATKWSIAIGDVMGKGVPAGLIMTMTRGMLRAEVLNGNTPAKILQHLNRVMYIDLENSSRFVTLFYSEYDPQTRMLSYSNAAHNPPMLWRSGDLQSLDTAGMLIGLEPDNYYEESHVQLQSGDVILYYTDGLTDAADLNGQRFDEENLRRSFVRACEQHNHPQPIADDIFREIRAFTGTEQEQSDDMTAVILRLQ